MIAELGAGYRIEEWSDMFVAVAGAGAALAGLVFVAVSINIDRILKLPGVPNRGLATVLLLLSVVVVSVLGLAPGQGTTAFGIELLVCGLGLGGTISVLYFRAERLSTAEHGGIVVNRIIVLLGTVPIAVAGLSLIAEAGGGLYWVFGAVVAALVGAVVNAWVLLVEILR